MFIPPTEDQRICAWFECQSEETLRDLEERFDAVSPRECWHAFFNDCPPPAPQSPDDLIVCFGGAWLHRHELEELSHDSDDYELISSVIADYDTFFRTLGRSQVGEPVCPPPAPQSPGESLAAPASAVQEVCTPPTIEQFQRWLETEAHAANQDLCMGYINETQEQENERVRLQELRLRACRVATALLLDFKDQA